ncbi:MAG: PAS domain-containing protein [Alphaproteobacteria bacterium]|nr:PAS domain-containing protein [Alphaproteobacteria bacterium]MCB9796609.1 PAS domain-containing protein [Alphaproteobacteria bacterium]
MNAAHALETGELESLHVRLVEARRQRDVWERRVQGLEAALEALEAESAGATLPPLEAAAPPPSPFAGRLGIGLAPGVPSPVQPPPSTGPLQLGNIDLGLMTRLSAEQLNGLPFGVVTLDARGRILAYNDTESRMAGIPVDAVLGRNFFSEVAPCTRVREFEGRFQDFASGRSRLGMETFEFVFHFSAGAQRVVILVTPARLRGQFHVSMIRR